MSKSTSRLLNLRFDYGFTQLEIANLLRISRTVYCYYENGYRFIPLHIYWALADFYGTSIDYLFGRSDVR